VKNLYKIFFLSVLLGQYEYNLEDINPTSESYGELVGTSYFEGNITLHYFGHFT